MHSCMLCVQFWTLSIENLFNNQSFRMALNSCSNSVGSYLKQLSHYITCKLFLWIICSSNTAFQSCITAIPISLVTTSTFQSKTLLAFFMHVLILRLVQVFFCIHNTTSFNYIHASLLFHSWCRAWLSFINLQTYFHNNRIKYSLNKSTFHHLQYEIMLIQHT